MRYSLTFFLLLLAIGCSHQQPRSVDIEVSDCCEPESLAVSFREFQSSGGFEASDCCGPGSLAVSFTKIEIDTLKRNVHLAGRVTDHHTNDLLWGVAFALGSSPAAYWTNTVAHSDTLGYFRIEMNIASSDTLAVLYIGYEALYFSFTQLAKRP